MRRLRFVNRIQNTIPLLNLLQFIVTEFTELRDLRQIEIQLAKPNFHAYIKRRSRPRDRTSVVDKSSLSQKINLLPILNTKSPQKQKTVGQIDIFKAVFDWMAFDT